MEYKIAIFEKDKMYLERLVSYLRSHHGESFKISLPELEITDLEEFKYDAIFIGDGMESVMEDIADDTITAFITGDNDKKDNLSIYKYQKSEQIYNQMLEICEKAEFVSKTAQSNINTYDIELTTLEDEYGCYKVFRLTDDAVVDNVAIGMLSNNKIEGIADIISSKDSLKYKVTDKISLIEYLQKNNDENIKNNLLKIVRNILNTMFSLGEYMLDLDRIVLVPKYIYVDEKTLECELIYYPLQCAKNICTVEDILRKVIETCESIIDNVNDNEVRNAAAVLPDAVQADVVNEEDEIEENEEIDELKENEEDEFGGTEIFSNLQKTAEESIEMKELTDMLANDAMMPFIKRRKNGESVIINRNIFKIGKDESYVDYCIKNNPTVSRNHADIVRKPDGYYIVDKGSLNHTFINGKRIEPQVYEKLKNGDLIQLADEIFEFTAAANKNREYI